MAAILAAPGGSGVNWRAREVGREERADILYHPLAAPPPPVTTTTTVAVVEKASWPQNNRIRVQVEEAWPRVREGVADEEEEEEFGDESDRFGQRQMYTSRSLPEICRKQRGKQKRSKELLDASETRQPVNSGDEADERFALLGAKSSIQMATLTSGNSISNCVAPISDGLADQERHTGEDAAVVVAINGMTN